MNEKTLEFIIGRDSVEMAKYLGSVIPKEKEELIKKGLSDLMTTIFLYGMIAGAAILLLFIGLFKVVT